MIHNNTDNDDNGNGNERFIIVFNLIVSGWQIKLKKIKKGSY